MASEKSKLLAKNATLLYLRQIIAMAISFYTSRVVLEALGVSDFGVFNLVGGIIVMMSILNGLLGEASSRYLTYNLGRGDKEMLSVTFCTTYYSYIAVGAVFLLACETIGLWIVNTQLDIPEGRMFAANVVYQVAVVNTLLGLTQVPYTATIIAHEHFGIFAYLSIGINVLKLVIALITLYSSLDHLILYAVLYAGVALVDRTISRIYCVRHFEESRLRRVFDKKLFLKMLSFSSWSVVGGMSSTLCEQLRAIFLNRFFGTVLNAAGGVASQVWVTVLGFIGNVATAFRPQIVKEYAQKNYARVNWLVQTGSKFSGLCVILIAVPVMVNLDFLFGLWLKEVPRGAVDICRVMLASLLFHSFNPMPHTAVMARGDVKWLNLLTAISEVLTSALYFLILYFFHSYVGAYATMFFNIIFTGLCFQLLLKRYMPAFDLKAYILRAMIPIACAFVLALLAAHFAAASCANKWLALIASTAASTAVIAALGYYVVLDKGMREMAKNYFGRKFKKKN